MKYFVIAIGGDNRPVPIMRGDDEDQEYVALFDTYNKAEEMAEHQPLCSARGYEIVKWPHK